MSEAKEEAVSEVTEATEVEAAPTEENSVRNGGERTDPDSDSVAICVTIGATVPTGFECTASAEVLEKIGSESRISKDRGRIYFEVSIDNLFEVHLLRSVDNLFVVVQEFPSYQFDENKEAALEDFKELVAKLSWARPLDVWKLNNSLKKRKFHRRKSSESCDAQTDASGDASKRKGDQSDLVSPSQLPTEDQLDNGHPLASPTSGSQGEKPRESEENSELPNNTMAFVDYASVPPDDNPSDKEEDAREAAKAKDNGLLRFRVTCNRAGDKHSFTSMEAARNFGGAVQDMFQWKADMTKFDVEVLLNIHDGEMVVGIALTEESLHRRNITHFGPTTLRSTIAYGMLRLCNPQPTDIIVDPMCGTGAIPIEGALEFPRCYYLAGDNNVLAVNRSINNISSIQKQRMEKGRTACGMPLDVLQWNLCNLPMKTNSVDVIISDMPFGKRMGSRKKNWDLYPACLKEMGRVCRPETGRAVLLTQDKKCFIKAMSKMGQLWRKSHTVWVNVGGLHAAVYLLKRSGVSFDKLFNIHRENGHPREVCSSTKVEE
uniref:THUMP domain-containing protein 3 n=1 Tax=Callorhinchus milii TaxID=7868 RepID=V9KIT8_CALMI